MWNGKRVNWKRDKVWSVKKILKNKLKKIKPGTIRRLLLYGKNIKIC